MLAKLLARRPRDAGKSESLGPLPASVRALSKDRPFGVVSPPIGVFPLRGVDGRTFAERKAAEKAA